MNKSTRIINDDHLKVIDMCVTTDEEKTAVILTTYPTRKVSSHIEQVKLET